MSVAANQYRRWVIEVGESTGDEKVMKPKHSENYIHCESDNRDVDCTQAKSSQPNHARFLGQKLLWTDIVACTSLRKKMSFATKSSHFQQELRCSPWRSSLSWTAKFSLKTVKRRERQLSSKGTKALHAKNMAVWTARTLSKTEPKPTCLRFKKQGCPWRRYRQFQTCKSWPKTGKSWKCPIIGKDTDSLHVDIAFLQSLPATVAQCIV